jgi:hypothetical protein
MGFSLGAKHVKCGIGRGHKRACILCVCVALQVNNHKLGDDAELLKLYPQV